MVDEYKGMIPPGWRVSGIIGKGKSSAPLLRSADEQPERQYAPTLGPIHSELEPGRLLQDWSIISYK
jgi:hypothetical protein